MALFVSVQVIVVPLLAGLSGAKISKITWIAAATALVGVGILESSGSPFAVSLSRRSLIESFFSTEVTLASVQFVNDDKRELRGPSRSPLSRGTRTVCKISFQRRKVIL